MIVNGNADDDTISKWYYANSTIYGGRQKDTISVGEITDGMVRGDANEDDITVTGALTNAIINGNAGGDQITFNTGANLSLLQPFTAARALIPSISPTPRVFTSQQVRTEMIST